MTAPEDKDENYSHYPLRRPPHVGWAGNDSAGVFGFFGVSGVFGVLPTSVQCMPNVGEGGFWGFWGATCLCLMTVFQKEEEKKYIYI